MENEPWLIIDEHSYDVIVGNKEGLNTLKAKIEKVVAISGNELCLEKDGIAIEKIIISEKEEYISLNEEEKLWEKIIGIFLIMWFLILPFVAIGFIVKTIL